MIESVSFLNYRVLHRTTLPLERLTLLIGPNGSGKSTALQGIELAASAARAGTRVGITTDQIASAEEEPGPEKSVEIRVKWHPPPDVVSTLSFPFLARGASSSSRFAHQPLRGAYDAESLSTALEQLASFRIYAFNAPAIAASVFLKPQAVLEPSGAGLAGLLDKLRDQHPEQFELLNSELRRWMPEFDRVLFETPQDGHRSVALRTRRGGYNIRANDLSQGSLLALALIALAYAPDTPSVLAIEEPEHGLHPRLLREVRDTLFRLCYPEEFGELRPAKQVIVTSHSPYLLDFFRENPEKVVIAQKELDGVKFERLTERPDLDDLLGGVGLGEAWYSGVLGGVPLPG